MPNGEIIYSTHTAYLQINTLPEEARRAHIFPRLNKVLLSIGTIFYHGCIAVVDDKWVTISEKLTGKIHITEDNFQETGL